jgi:energy-coupling factor transporter ATP-binding protein EcfA2
MALVGAFGSGKSTLLTIQSGLDVPTAGTPTTNRPSHRLRCIRSRHNPVSASRGKPTPLCGPVAVIPEGAGPVKPTGLVVVTGSSCFPARCGHTSSRVPGSRLDRRSTRAAGVALTSVPSGAESLRREQGFGLLVAVCSNVQCGRGGGTGDPVAGHPFATGVGGMELYGRSQVGINQCGRPRHGWGVRQQATSRPGCAGTRLMPVGAGNGSVRRGARRRPT